MFKYPEIVAEIFDVSNSEAEIIVRYWSNRIHLVDISEKDYEKTINSLLGDSLNEKLSWYR